MCGRLGEVTSDCDIDKGKCNNSSEQPSPLFPRQRLIDTLSQAIIETGLVKDLKLDSIDADAHKIFLAFDIWARV